MKDCNANVNFLSSGCAWMWNTKHNPARINAEYLIISFTFVWPMAEIGKDINKAKFLLEQGELVAIPTETVYGLAGHALDTTAVTKIFEVKNRPAFDPLIVHIAN